MIQCMSLTLGKTTYIQRDYFRIIAEEREAGASPHLQNAVGFPSVPSVPVRKGG